MGLGILLLIIKKRIVEIIFMIIMLALYSFYVFNGILFFGLRPGGVRLGSMKLALFAIPFIFSIVYLFKNRNERKIARRQMLNE
ncbi:MAG TPA: hypothetical protein VFD05_04685 [Bacilli bacterium]|nr:hypothetical protein [Bacilli bacterium]